MAIDPFSIPISFYGGESFIPPPISYVDVNGAPINLTSYTATMMIRGTVNAVNPPLINANTSNGMISINGPAGQIQINIPALVTSTVAVPFSGVWDLFIYSPLGIATRLVGGTININEAVVH